MMSSINRLLKIKLLFLALLFPLFLSVAGFMVGMFTKNIPFAILFSISGVAIGILLNIIGYSRKLFTLALFYTPVPLALFMLSWWIADLFTGSNVSLLIGLLGFFVGIWLNYELVLPYQFYKIKKRILAVIYIFFSISCLGFFMGIPVFNILLGILAGNYLSIRVMDNYNRQSYVTKNLRQGSLFTALVLLLLIVYSLLVAFSDIDHLIQLAEQMLRFSFTHSQFYFIAITGGIALVILQYFITLITAKTMFEYWMSKKKASRE
ncbi:MAG: hypothetical protein WCX31_14845 [Salinivirgaceae bacterium]